MLSSTIKKLAIAVKGEIIGNKQAIIKTIFIDSRNIHDKENSLFIAIKGIHNDGHDYIAGLIKIGIKNFIVQKQNFKSFDKYKSANFIIVNDSLKAIHLISSFHRKAFSIPVIGITGSNGKTMVKEWLNYVLHDTLVIARSPKSYNSQVGVPLSIWQLNDNVDLGIFEAGISMPGEMKKLEKIIRPTIGLITNIGPPHQENFKSLTQKLKEKLELFKNCKKIFYCRDHELIHETLNKNRAFSDKNTFTWSLRHKADLEIKSIKKINNNSLVKAKYKNQKIEYSIPFTDDASIENSIHVLSISLYLEVSLKTISRRFKTLPSVEMRMELLTGANNCTLINDIYNSDYESLKIALDFLGQQNKLKKKTIILSDILQSGLKPKELYGRIASLINDKEIFRFIGIGENIIKYRDKFQGNTIFYNSTSDFIAEIDKLNFNNESILLKGSRIFKFEKITNLLQEKTHSTVLEINLDALVNNLNFFRSLLKPETKIMVMVKAFSYGSGTYEIANLLQFHKVDYLAVAIADEGISLRKNGIKLPIIVMNPEVQSYGQLIAHKLEPEIYNFKTLYAFQNAILEKKMNSYPVHLKIDTGMHRLGFMKNETNELIETLDKTNFEVKSVFTHLAASDEPVHDSFTKKQFETFIKISGLIIEKLNYPVIRHILNSSGIERFPEMQLEMTRLGIGLYGISSINQKTLQNISVFKTRISQIKELDTTETIGYNRKGLLKTKSRIGIIPVGYADGLNRLTGNGKWKVKVNNKLAPTIGNICMDMCMIDLTDADAKEGDEVEIFGNSNTIIEMANCINTIPYEILTSVSQRVKRLYYKD